MLKIKTLLELINKAIILWERPSSKLSYDWFNMDGMLRILVDQEEITPEDRGKISNLVYKDADTKFEATIKDIYSWFKELLGVLAKGSMYTADDIVECVSTQMDVECRECHEDDPEFYVCSYVFGRTLCRMYQEENGRPMELPVIDACKYGKGPKFYRGE